MSESNYFKTLGKHVRAINDANGWLVPETDTPIEQIASLALITTEVSEAIEDVRNGDTVARLTINGHRVHRVTHGSNADWTTDPDGDGAEMGKHGPAVWTGVTPKPEGLPSELADIIIRTVDFAATRGIDLDKAVAEKVAYNETREFRHGGKAL